MTAANRLQRLRQADLIRFSVTPNFAAQGLTTRILGLLQADVSALTECTALLTGSPYVLRVDQVTGEYDLAFTAAFPSEVALGTMVRDLQSLVGVRRLVVHHVLDTQVDEDGWGAIWAEPALVEDPTFEIAPGVRVAEHLRPKVALAAHWVHAFVNADTETLARLSEPDISFSILPGHTGEGVYDGFDAVAEQSRIAGAVYRHLWHRIMAVSETAAPYDIVVDAFNTAERRRGQVWTAFVRMAFAFSGERVSRALTVGQVDLPDLPAEAVTSAHS